MKPVFCEKCAYLFLDSREDSIPVCLVDAKFIRGPIRPDIDLVFLQSAEIRNRQNDCVSYCRYSLRAKRIKEWLLRSLNNGKNTSEVYEANIGSYPRTKEKEHWKTIRKSEKTSNEGSEETETVEPVRGDDDSIGGATPDKERDQFLFDFQSDDGSEG